MFTLKNYSLFFILVALLMTGCQCMDNYYYDDGVGDGGARNLGGSRFAGASDESYARGGGGGGGCAGRGKPATPPYDRPFALGQVADAHTDTQQTNAEAAKFILYDHEFRETEHDNGTVTTVLTPDGKKHLTQIAVRLPQVPFPVVIEETDDPTVNELRRTNVVRWLCAFHTLADNDPRRGVIKGRVVVAPAIEDGVRAEEAAAAFSQSQYSTSTGYGGGGRY